MEKKRHIIRFIETPKGCNECKYLNVKEKKCGYGPVCRYPAMRGR